TLERTRVIVAGGMMGDRSGVRGRRQAVASMATGASGRVCVDSLGEGLERTLKWYYESKRLDSVERDLDRLLTER
ncbi:MAG: hypothetical protein ACHQQP_02845, partial [Gemmatimonadales bacterium]